MSSNPLPSGGVSPGFAVLYRWRLREGAEESFVQAWSLMTDALRARGSLGSRLHRGSDGLWYAYAQWPNARTREEAFAQGPADPAALSQMRAAIAESFPEIVLDVVADLIGPAPVGVATDRE